MAHWKFGDGFAIRYGGFRDIEWFHGEEFRTPGAGVGIPPLHPAAVALEAAKVMGLVLQWWEVRKQRQYLEAQFEERRLFWLVDMLTAWAVDVTAGGTLRLDSTRYLERELTRLMAVLIKTPKMDIPSSLLLQVDRTSLVLVDLNTFLHRELSHQINHGKGRKGEWPSVPEYQPFNEIRSLVLNPDGVKARPKNFFEELKKKLPWIFYSEEDPFTVYVRNAKRRAEFSAIENLIIELRSAIKLLETAQAFPPTIRSFSKKEVLEDKSGTIVSQPADSGIK